jgi:endo-1,4-beta-D-glucanase Y
MPLASRRSRRAFAIAAASAAVSALVACGGGNGGSSGGETPPPSSSSASRPFPQNAPYAAGFRATNISADDARAQYQLWKTRYLKSDCGAGLTRVEFTEPMGSTVSEGMGYGLLLTAYFGDKTEFDQLYAFVKKNQNSHGLMGWKVTCAGWDNSVGGANAATDGELDIAMGVVVAANQWGGSYWNEATTYVRNIKTYLWSNCGSRVVQKPGDPYGGCDLSNTSYWMPGYYRVFRELTGDGFWDQAVADTYALIVANRDPNTGLMSNETDQYGAVLNNYPMVDYNGCRIPWRIGTDYIWWGAPEAKEETDRITNWAASRGISSIADGFYMDGRNAPGHTWNRSNPFTGGFAVGAMAHSQGRVDEFAAWFKGCNADDGYYGTSLRALYMLALSGNFWKPTGQH